jgi:hypothetical protein
MMIKVVVPISVINKLWAMGTSGEAKLLPGGKEGVLELHGEDVSNAIDLFDDPTFGEALERLIDTKLFPSDVYTPEPGPGGDQ